MCRKFLTLVRSWITKDRHNKIDNDFTNDDAYLQSIRSLWRNKDWPALTKINDADIYKISNRSEIAFIIGIAHAELDSQDGFIAFSNLASEWGLTAESMKKLIGEYYEKNCSSKFKADVMGSTRIGAGWATNTINTAIYRHHGILTMGAYQYTAYYESESVLTLVRLSANCVETYKLIGRYRLHDAHNSISLGHDRNHCLHITYDHHGTKLRYRRSLQPYTIDAWGEEQSMTGNYEDRVTYPTFINPRLEHPLTLLYRDGESDKGCARLKTFDENKGVWADHPVAILSGENNSPWTCNAYWNHPVIDEHGALHLSFVWRTHSIGPDQIVNNLNICYAKSADNGLTWHTSGGVVYRAPITPVNSEVIFAVPPGSNLINQCSMALDSNGFAHIAFYANDNTGIPQYFHLWLTDTGWNVRQVSNRKTPFQLKGIGTLPIPISRPEILVDGKNNVHILFRGDISNNQLSAYSASAPKYLAHISEFEILWPVDVGYAEPIIDRTRWNRDNILTLFVQPTNQPNGDVRTNTTVSPIDIIDIKFTQQTG
ncbi:BNR repeat-containing protein [Pseudomonas fulva]|uniref:BNR repeat-containing protein n=1 Tax=Pseudomonas fulva TaxID=47880 RepID=UPI0018AB79FF|nr:BNR repeat-containing protein [Pseudomonas fulva]MBF8637507.1 BNR repeat-containing protein [Pseudomonas fulva]MBF8689498.1 BNR repeat-containing protein [Pseudomonas fulva]